MDWLKCNICFNTYKNNSLRPLTLSCGHTFCQSCINITLWNGILPCPQCGQIHDINSTLNFPEHFTPEGILKSLNGSPDVTDEGCENQE